MSLLLLHTTFSASNLQQKETNVIQHNMATLFVFIMELKFSSWRLEIPVSQKHVPWGEWRALKAVGKPTVSERKGSEDAPQDRDPDPFRDYQIFSNNQVGGGGQKRSVNALKCAKTRIKVTLGLWRLCSRSAT